MSWERYREEEREGGRQLKCVRLETPRPARASLTPPPLPPQVPAVLTAAVAFNTDALNAIIKRHAYVQYPPEGPRPPPPDELRALAKKNGAASK